MAGLLITIREGLEAFLILGILFGYLNKLGQRSSVKYIWGGAGLAAALSAAVAVMLQRLGLEFEGESAEIFEVVVALLAVAVLTTVVLWMQRNSRSIKGELEARMEAALSSRQVLGLAFLAFVTVLREGLETALFLAAPTINQGGGLLGGALAGLVAAGLIAYLVFRTTVRLDLKRFFLVTGWLLVFVAAGLMSHIAHALTGIGLLPALVENVWDTSRLIADESLVGRLLHAFIGYTATPSLLQLLFYGGYLLVVGRSFYGRKLRRAAAGGGAL